MATETVLASINILGLDLVPEDVSARLGLTATSNYRRGDPVFSGSDTLRTRGCWSWRSPLPRDASITDHLQCVLETLRGKEIELNALMSSGMEGEVLCSYWPRRLKCQVDLPPDLLVEFSRLGLHLTLNVHAEAPDNGQRGVQQRGTSKRGNTRRKAPKKRP